MRPVRPSRTRRAFRHDLHRLCRRSEEPLFSAMDHGQQIPRLRHQVDSDSLREPSPHPSEPTSTQASYDAGAWSAPVEHAVHRSLGHAVPPRPPDSGISQSSVRQSQTQRRPAPIQRLQAVGISTFEDCYQLVVDAGMGRWSHNVMTMELANQLNADIRPELYNRTPVESVVFFPSMGFVEAWVHPLMDGTPPTKQLFKIWKDGMGNLEGGLFLMMNAPQAQNPPEPGPGPTPQVGSKQHLHPSTPRHSNARSLPDPGHALAFRGVVDAGGDTAMQDDDPFAPAIVGQPDVAPSQAQVPVSLSQSPPPPLSIATTYIDQSATDLAYTPSTAAAAVPPKFGEYFQERQAHNLTPNKNENYSCR